MQDSRSSPLSFFIISSQPGFSGAVPGACRGAVVGEPRAWESSRTFAILVSLRTVPAQRLNVSEKLAPWVQGLLKGRVARVVRRAHRAPAHLQPFLCSPVIVPFRHRFASTVRSECEDMHPL